MAMANTQLWDQGSDMRPASTFGKRYVTGAGADLLRVEVEAGAKAPRHCHDHAQFVRVLSGRGLVEIDGRWQAFAAGNIFHLPAGTWHAAAFDEDTILVETNFR